MADQSNLEYLISKGAVDSAEHISSQHQNSLNNDFSREEIDAIIKLKNKITGVKFASRPTDDDDTSGMAAL